MMTLLIVTVITPRGHVRPGLISEVVLTHDGNGSGPVSWRLRVILKVDQKTLQALSIEIHCSMLVQESISAKALRRSLCNFRSRMPRCAAASASFHLNLRISAQTACLVSSRSR